MSSLAKRWIIVASVIVGIMAIVGTTVGVLLNRSPNTVARSDRLESPEIKGVERLEDRYLLTFSYIADAIGYRVSEYDEVNEERHTQSYSGEQVIYAGEYVKVDITDFLFATHTEEDFKRYNFTALAKFSDPVFNSKESAVFVYENKITLETPTIQQINPNAKSMRWETIEYATSYDISLEDEDDSNNNVVINTTETYVTFEKIKQIFGDLDSYSLCVVAKNASLTKQDYILKSEKSKPALYLPTGQLESCVLVYNAENNNVSWAPVVGADRYYLYINTFGVSSFANTKDNGNLFTTTANAIVCDLSQIEYASYLGTIEIYVVATSENENITESESNVITFVNKSKLAAPSNIKLASDSNYLQIKWDDSADAQFAAGYSIIIYRYTTSQISQNNLITSPQNFNEVAKSGYTSSINECTIPLGINPDGYYGVAVQAKGVVGSMYEDSEFAYYQNEVNNKNLYNANKTLPAPDGIVASENLDGSISVSWNIVENARRYYVRIKAKDGTSPVDTDGNAELYIPVVDTREEVNRVNTKIPPATIQNLLPGQYIVAVRTESEGYLTSNGNFNDVVAYPEGQQYVAYRTPYDLTDINVQFNMESKSLTWALIDGAFGYEVFVGQAGHEKQSVGTTQSLEYSLVDYFADLTHDTGTYEISVLVKASSTNYRIDTMSDSLDYNFVQNYANPTGLVVLDGENVNERVLKWTPSANANETTSYTIKVGDDVVKADYVLQQNAIFGLFNITEFLSLGQNSISVVANEDQTHKTSATSTIAYTYQFTLYQIEGDVEVVAQSVEYGLPTIGLKFTPVENASNYNIKINDEEVVNYTATLVSGEDKVLITLSQADSQNLALFKTNTIKIYPNIKENVVYPNNVDDIIKTITFKNIYGLSAVQGVSVSPDSTKNALLEDTNIIESITPQEINLTFNPLVMQGDWDEGLGDYETTSVADYQVLICAGNDVVATKQITIDPSLASVTINLFNDFPKTTSGQKFVAGTYNIKIAAILGDVVGLQSTSNNIQISSSLQPTRQITYAETEEAMVLSWTPVEEAEVYDIVVKTEDGLTTVATETNVAETSVDLTQYLYNQEVGTYKATVIAKRTGSQSSENASDIEVVKKLHFGEITLSKNNTEIDITSQNLPRTLYKAQNGDYVYASKIMLVFDSLSGAEYGVANGITTEAGLAGYNTKLVSVDGSDLEIDISSFAGAQTCYAYAFETSDQSTISDIFIIDLTGVIKYSNPNIVMQAQNNELVVSWNVEKLPFENGTLTIPDYYTFDLFNADQSLLSTAVVTVAGYNSNNEEISSLLSISGNNIEIDHTNEFANTLSKIVLTFDTYAGLYVAKVGAVSSDIAYARNSNIVESSYVFKKTLPTPNTRIVKSSEVQSAYGSTLITDFNLDAETLNTYFGTYSPTISFDTIDGNDLSIVELQVYKTDETYLNNIELITQKTYTITASNSYGYYLELNKQVLNIKEKIDSETGSKYYTVKFRYASFNSSLYDQNDFTLALNLQVTKNTPVVQVFDVNFAEADNAFTFSWDSVGRDVNYTVNVTDSSSNIKYTDTISDFQDQTISYNKSLIASYDPTEIYKIEFVITPVVGGGETAITTTNYYCINTSSSFEYNKDLTDLANNELVINTKNNISYVDGSGNSSITSVSLNGYIFAVTANSLSSIKISGGTSGVSSNADDAINAVRKTLDLDRNVTVVVYAGTQVMFEWIISKFPVLIKPYADGIEVVNDLLYWNSVEFASGYVVYNANNASNHSSVLTSNSVGLASLFDAGGSYDVYVEVLDDNLNNVYLQSAVLPSPTNILYEKPYESVINLSYNQTYNSSTQAFNKSISFGFGTNTNVPTDGNKKFTIVVSGPQNFTLFATNNGNDALQFSVDQAGVYTIDLTQQLNNISVGDYQISVSVGAITNAVGSTNSKNTTITFKNNKVISLPTSDFYNYFDVTPDKLVSSTDAQTNIAISSAQDFENYISNFNEKFFTLKTKFDFATTIIVSINSHEVALENINNATSGSKLLINSVLNEVQIKILLNRNSEIGRMEYYYIPTTQEIGIDGIEKLEDGTGVVRTYQDVEFYYAEPTPSYAVVETATPQEGQSGSNSLQLQIQNPTEGTYLVNFYFFEDSQTFDPTISSKTEISKILTLEEVGGVVNGTFDFEELLQSLQLSYKKGYITISRIYDGANEKHLSSFHGILEPFDYYYALGDIHEVTPQQNGKLVFELLDVQSATKVKYNLTVKDANGNSKLYECIVEYDSQSGTYALSDSNSILIKQLFEISVENNKALLTFNVTDFTTDATRTNFYLVGEYSYEIYASDPEGLTLPEERSQNNIISSKLLENDFNYNVIYPLNDIVVNLEGNELVWTYRDGSGLLDNQNLPIDLGSYWEYSIDGSAWQKLYDVEREVDENTKLITSRTKIMLNYGERFDVNGQYKNNIRLRVNINSSDFVEDTQGVELTNVTNPKMPDVLDVSLDVLNARELSFKFDNSKINRSTTNKAYFLDDLNNNLLALKLTISLTYDNQTYEFSLEDDNLITWYTKGSGSVSLLQLMTPAQKQSLTTTKNDVTELKEGIYKVQVILSDTLNKHIESVSEEKVFTIAPRFEISNVSVSGANITYYGDVVEAGNKIPNQNNATNWANGDRNTVVSFDIATSKIDENYINAVKSGLKLVAWVVAYNDLNGKTLTVSTDKTTISLSSLTENEGSWRVSFDLSSVWNKASLSKEYFVGFYVDTYSLNNSTIIMRSSVPSTHSDDNNELQNRFNVSDSRAIECSIINYKWMPQIALNDALIIDEVTKEQSVGWTITSQNNTNDIFAVDLTLQRVYWSNANSWESDQNSKTITNVISNPYSINNFETNFVNEGFYKFILTLSNQANDSYYLGDNGSVRLSSKVYQYFELFAGIDVETTSKHSGEKAVLSETDLSNSDEVSQYIIIDEGEEASTKKISITFDQPTDPVAPESYRLEIKSQKTNNISCIYYVGINYDANNDQNLYIYYLSDGNEGYTTLYSDVDANLGNAFKLNLNEPVGKIDGNKVVLDGFTLEQLFTSSHIFDSADYDFIISAHIPIYQKLTYSHGAGIAANLNDFNAKEPTVVRAYIKFKTPEIAVALDNSSTTNTNGGNTYIENKNGEYTYTLNFTVSNLGTNANTAGYRDVAIFLSGHYKLEEAYIKRVYYTNTSTTISVEIKDQNLSTFANLVNESLPASLTFFAVVLPENGLWANEDYKDLIVSTESSDDKYNDTNKFIKNNVINSVISVGSNELKLGIQLPNVPLNFMVNNSIAKDVTNLEQMVMVNGVFVNKLQIGMFGTQGAGLDAYIATDPYLAYDSKQFKTREYLYENKFKTSDFKFLVYAKSSKVENSTYTLIKTGNSNNENFTISITDVISCDYNKTLVNASTNLYSALKNQFSTGGEIKLKFVLTYTGDQLYYESEGQEFDFDFYVRNEDTITQFSFELDENNKVVYNYENAKTLTYYVDNYTKKDYVYPSVGAAISEVEENETILVGLKRNGSDLTYYFTTSATSDVDIMDWIIKKCLDVVKQDQHKIGDDYWLTDIYDPSSTDKTNFIVDSLLADWTISYSVINSNGNVLTGYQKLGGTFSPQLKLNNNASVSYYNTTGKNIVSFTITIDTRPTFEHINTTAKAIELWCGEGEGSFKYTYNIPNGGYTLTNSTLDAIYDIQNAFESWCDGKNSNNYEISYKFVYDNEHVVESDAKVFDYPYYEVTTVEFAVTNIVDGKTANIAINNNSSEYKILGFESSVQVDGILIYMPLPSSKFKSGNFAQDICKSQDNTYVTHGICSIYLTDDGLTTTDPSGQFVGWFVRFYDKYADCLGTGTPETNASYLQAGVVYNITVTYVINSQNFNSSENDYNVYAFKYTGSEQISTGVKKYSTKQTISSEKLSLNPIKYLTFNDIKPLYESGEFSLDLMTKNSNNQDNPIVGHQHCDFCEGMKQLVYNHDVIYRGAHEYEAKVTNYSSTNDYHFYSYLHRAWVTYVCKHCGNEKTVDTGISTIDYTSSEIESKIPLTVTEGSGCTYMDNCPKCDGLGYIPDYNSAIPTWIGTNSDSSLISYEYGETIKAQDDESGLTIGQNIELLKKGNNDYALFTNGTLSMQQTLQGVVFYSQYPLTLEWTCKEDSSLNGSAKLSEVKNINDKHNGLYMHMLVIDNLGENTFTCKFKYSPECFKEVEGDVEKYKININTALYDSSYNKPISFDSTWEILSAEFEFEVSAQVVYNAAETNEVDQKSPVRCSFGNRDGDRGYDSCYFWIDYTIQNDTHFTLELKITPNITGHFEATNILGADGTLHMGSGDSQIIQIKPDQTITIRLRHDEGGGVGDFVNWDHFDSVSGDVTVAIMKASCGQNDADLLSIGYLIIDTFNVDGSTKFHSGIVTSVQKENYTFSHQGANHQQVKTTYTCWKCHIVCDGCGGEFDYIIRSFSDNSVWYKRAKNYYEGKGFDLSLSRQLKEGEPEPHVSTDPNNPVIMEIDGRYCSAITS